MNCGSARYDYETAWRQYAFDEEENRFLSMEEEDLLKICDCVDLTKKWKKFSGGIPVHYADGKLYVLKEGPHTRVCGESGSKKSRTVCRGAAISAALNLDSLIITDPKGEISSDPKVQWLLKKTGHAVHVLDFRSFNRDGFNCLSYAFEMMERGLPGKAMSAIDRFVGMLVDSKQGADDPFWNSQAGDYIRFSAQMLLIALSQIRGGKAGFNLASVKSFIRQNRTPVKSIMEQMAKQMPANTLCNPVSGYNEILQNPERTYACIVSSANALLSEFAQSEELLRMLSIQTFDIREFYRRPTALFLVVPDEVSTYDRIVGYLVDTFYQILVEEYGETYQGKSEPPCSLHVICDEVASIQINDMSSKISASRSRQIDWTLIYQSEVQMENAYKKDYGTIVGNCKNYIFLGSSDYQILKTVSDQVGTTNITPEGLGAPLVSVNDLRRMRKERSYKDALVITGNDILCAQLPDYDSYPFLKELPPSEWPENTAGMMPTVYTPEELFADFQKGRVNFAAFGKAKRKKNPSKEDLLQRDEKTVQYMKELFDHMFGEEN